MNCLINWQLRISENCLQSGIKSIILQHWKFHQTVYCNFYGFSLTSICIDEFASIGKYIVKEIRDVRRVNVPVTLKDVETMFDQEYEKRKSLLLNNR